MMCALSMACGYPLRKPQVVAHRDNEQRRRRRRGGGRRREQVMMTPTGRSSHQSSTRKEGAAAPKTWTTSTSFLKPAQARVLVVVRSWSSLSSFHTDCVFKSLEAVVLLLYVTQNDLSRSTSPCGLAMIPAIRPHERCQQRAPYIFAPSSRSPPRWAVVGHRGAEPLIPDVSQSEAPQNRALGLKLNSTEIVKMLRAVHPKDILKIDALSNATSLDTTREAGFKERGGARGGRDVGKCEWGQGTASVTFSAFRRRW